MKNKKYVVCRDNIYIGEVVRTDSIYRYEGDHDFFRTKPGHRMFSSVSESPLPREYWDVLDDRGDNTLIDVLKR